MPERLFRFFLKFLLVSVVLSFLWVWRLNQDYVSFFVTTVHFFSFLSGLNLSLPIPTSFFHNLIPFTALMLVTPPVLSPKRFWLLLAGWLIVVLEHLLVSVYLYQLLDVWKVSDSTYSWFTPLSILSGTFPFLLWLLLLREQTKLLFIRRAYSNSPK